MILCHGIASRSSSLSSCSGSGVSILKVEGPGKYKRVSGTSVGGGTVRGIAQVLSVHC